MGQSVKIQPLSQLRGMHKIRAILFDLYNTLIDFIRIKGDLAMVASGLLLDENEGYERLMKTYFAIGIESNNAFLIDKYYMNDTADKLCAKCF